MQTRSSSSTMTRAKWEVERNTVGVHRRALKAAGERAAGRCGRRARAWWPKTWVGILALPLYQLCDVRFPSLSLPRW